MARKPQPASPATPVRWTDLEWQAIAARILTMRGAANPASVDVADIKAKDVFVAQDVLPEPRRRKLISIQQGFDVSRQRLHAQLHAPPSPETKKTASGAAEPVRPRSRSHTKIEEKVPGKGSAREKTKASAGLAASSDNAVMKPANELNRPVTKAVQETVNAMPGHPGALAKAHGSGGTTVDETPEKEPSSWKEAVPASAGDSTELRGDARALAGTQTQRHGADGKATKPPGDMVRSSSAGSDFVELARPFVAMVCEELAKALVKALGETASAGALSAVVGTKLTGAASAGPESGGQRETFRAEENGPLPSGSAKPDERGSLDQSDAEEHAEADVQPLFDPKLPPDPRSPFRPRIALVAPRPDDLAELQQRFPQFELIAVTLDELRSSPVLRTCQRIVGLREDVPAAADEYLRRTCGSRYFRANGGVAKVREQLQSWLNNPSVGSADAFRPAKQGNVKGASAKKRQFRRPRST